MIWILKRSLKKTGAVLQWGIDHPEELTKWGPGIQFIKEGYFTSNEEIEKLNFSMRLMFKLAGLFAFDRKAQRLLVYKVG